MIIIKGGAEMPNHFDQQAVVIGGSLTGLMTARVLADHFDRVTILERDHIDDRPACINLFPRATISTDCC
jgi:2-polyprenyl-6-methoxyphenol hydroxylase-like FAD-dependent oxidoreductase